MSSITKYSFLLLTLYLLNTGYSAESLFLEKGEVVIDEDFSDDSINEKIWPLAKKRPVGQKTENGFYHYDFSQRSKKNGKRIGLGHYLSEPIGDLILEFKYMTTNGFKSLNLGFNDEQGHCLVIRLDEHKMYSWKYKEKNKRSFTEFQDMTGAKLRDGEEYTIIVEISGPNLFVHLDDQQFLIGQNERFKNPKTKIFFGFLGGQGKVDSVKVWKGKALANPDISKWTTKKAQRYPVDPDHDKKFMKSKLLADARVSLMDDKEFLRLLKATEEKWQSIRHKEKGAKKSNEDYNKLLSEFSALEKAELEYIYERFPTLR